jgi:hypothetical protein
MCSDGYGPRLIGKRVHYVSYGGPQCRAAIVTQVAEDFDESAMVGLCVLNPACASFLPLSADGEGCEIDKGSELGVRASWSCDGYDHQSGTWHVPVVASNYLDHPDDLAEQEAVTRAFAARQARAQSAAGADAESTQGPLDGTQRPLAPASLDQ